MHRTNWARVPGVGRSRAESQEQMRAGMSPGGRKTGSSASKTYRSGSSAAADASSESRSSGPAVDLAPGSAIGPGADPASGPMVGPAADSAETPQVRTHSWRSQRPVTLRRYLMVPSTPPSLVKLASLLSSVRTGASSSRPTSDQVPEEM